MEARFRDRFLPTPWARYAFALTLFGAALLARLLLLPAEARLAFSTFLPAVALTMYLCGVGPGTLVTAVSVLAGAYFFSPPYYSWAIDTGSQWAAVAFLSATAVIGWVVHQLEATSGRLRATLDRLRSSERMLQTVVNDQTEMVFRFGRDGRFLFANPAGRRAFGLTDESMPIQTWHVLVAPEEQAGVTQRLRTFSPGRPVVRTETRFPGLDGETRWGEFVHHARFDEAGQLTEVQTVGRDITERRLLQEQLAEVTAKLQDLYDGAPCGYYSLNAAGKFVQLNATSLAWLGCTAEEALGKLGPGDFFTAQDVAVFERSLRTLLDQGHVGPVEYDLLARDGSSRRISVSATALRDPSGAFVRSRSVMYDMTELEQARRALRALNRQQEAMLDNDLVGITKLKDRNAVWQNRALERMFGYGPGEMEGQPARILYPDDASYEALGQAAYPVLAAGGTYRTQLRLVRKDGSPIWVDMSGAIVSPETGESMWMMLDITDMKKHQEKVEEIAFHDALTGLPNRILLVDRLRQAIPLADRLNSLVAVCFIDLDGFKAVNDRLGHAAGDRLLQVIGARLQECVRGNDTVARLGGDEFVLLLTHLLNREECNQVLARIVKAIGEPVELGVGEPGQVSASIGVAFCPDDGRDGAQLLRHADEAMYMAKKSGRNKVSTS